VLGLTETSSASEGRADPIEGVFAALGRRLQVDPARPITLALSGGGDSVALLALTVEWARSHGRRVLALSVDHGLNPSSADWTRFARETATRLGADWRGLAWTGPKPETGLPAAARAARHALLAEAARQAGATVLLFAHTRDDAREADRMRAEGTMLGRVREWAPSPAWPEGRDLFLLRPTLGATRADLRAVLQARGLDWIEDPANADLRYARARARLRAHDAEPASGSAEPAEALAPWAEACVADPRSGALSFARREPVRPAFLAAALLCAGGGDRPPRGPRLRRLAERLQGPEPRFTATLCGVRVEAESATVRLFRDAGESERGGLETVRTFPGAASVWDGRFEIETGTGALVTPAKGRMSLLSPEDREELRRFPAGARPALPLLLADGAERPVLAWRSARVRSLAGPRLRAACGLIAHERDIDDPPRGARVDASLC
jgi:tRNA(Ile)-lysidine synthase